MGARKPTPCSGSNACAGPSTRTSACSRRTTNSSRTVLSSRMLPLPRVKLGVSRRNGPRRYPQDGVECCHWVEPAIEPEDEFVEVGLQVLRLDATMMSAIEPRLEVAENAVDQWQVFLGVRGIASHDHDVVPVAVLLAQVSVPVVSVRFHLRALDHVRSDEWDERLGAAIAHDREP